MSKIDVLLSSEQLKNLKALLDQSQLGVHLLFDNKMISHVFQNSFSEDDFFQVDHIKLIQDDLLKLLQLKTLNDKKYFISTLDSIKQERLIRAYFYIIESRLSEQMSKSSLKAH